MAEHTDITVVAASSHPAAPSTLFLFEPQTLEGREWLEEHTDGQWWGMALVVEHRYADDLAAAALAAGLAVR